MYVQPTFQIRAGAPPALLRVSVFAGDSVRMGSTLAAALGTSGEARRSEPGAPRDLHSVSDSLYRTMRAALARGDWTEFGRAFDALGVALHTSGR